MLPEFLMENGKFVTDIILDCELGVWLGKLNLSYNNMYSNLIIISKIFITLLIN